MSYTKTTWSSGDTITATKLNNMETGIKACDTFTINSKTVYLADILASALFPISSGTGYVTLGNLSEWVSAGCPTSV